MVKIFLDAGHGGKDPGAVARVVKEKDLTLDIDSRIAKLLKDNNIVVERTRTTDDFVDSTPRATKVKNSKAKYGISSHVNAGNGLGSEILVSHYSNQRLAKEILKELGKIGLKVNRGVKTRKQKNGQDYYYMHRLTGNVETLIIEYGFIDTKSDRDFLTNPNNRQKCAEAVVKAICTVEGIKYKEEVKKPSTSNKELYKVQVGAYSDKSNADRKLAELKKQGHQAYIKKE